LAKEEAEAEQITEVVEEAKTEAEIWALCKGMTNPKSNVIIVRNMGTTQMNVGKNKMT